jgi:hypothetical protein
MHSLLTSFCRVTLISFLSFSFPSLSRIVKLSDLHTMAKRSDLVAHGLVGDKRVVTDQLGRLTTLTDIEVIDGLYGAKTGEIVTFYQVGGEKDGVVMPLVGGHVYNLGSEVILFGLSLGEEYVNYGAGQGKLDVLNEYGRETVREDLGDIDSAYLADGKHLFKPAPLCFDGIEMLKSEIRLMLKDRQ